MENGDLPSNGDVHSALWCFFSKEVRRCLDCSEVGGHDGDLSSEGDVRSIMRAGLPEVGCLAFLNGGQDGDLACVDVSSVLLELDELAFSGVVAGLSRMLDKEKINKFGAVKKYKKII